MEEIIQHLIHKNIPLTLDVATVIKLKGDVCHVESINTGKDFFNCRINAIESNDTNKLKITPAEGSTVVIGIFKGTDKAIIIAVSEVDKIEYQQATTNFKIDAEGYEITRGNENLKTVFNDMIDELNKIVVSVGVTINVVKMTAIKERLNNILK